MDYTLVEAHSPAELVELVRSHLAAGWEPSGGVAVATYGAGTWWYYQAMVRRVR